ncbi:NAD-dependent epimerase/dehydratase family protein [Micrococcus porci]|uniref:NAD-dependent epimerase/dehydratase family protein n=1 Tax=Micrococcus porci TaxID=2856555 RepID=UPI001CCCCE80|nr:NAD-dependent epimerase/dehydratase family protein [Micrococcus porci]UBH25673.1 NAD-dependent epimerase/dehydratase family protein [Micrococcus porci]
MRIVVLGATGNVGTALLERLHRAPEATELVGVSRRGPDRAGAPYDGVEWHRMDIADAASAPRLTEVLRGADAVVDLVWVIRPNRDRAHLRAVNVDGNERVFRAAAAAGVPHLVYASSVGAYGPGPKDVRVDESHPTTGVPTSHYAAQKAEVETILDRVAAEHPRMLVSRLRPGLIFQSGAGPEIKDYFLGDLVPARLAARLRTPVLPFPTGLRFQALTAQDVAEAYWQVVAHRAGGAFNVAAEPVLDAHTMGTVLGARRILELPVAVFRAAAAVSYRARLQPTDPGWVDMAAAVPVMDTSALRRATDWRPRTDARDAVRLVLDHLDGREGLGNAGHRSHSPLE